MKKKFEDNIKNAEKKLKISFNNKEYLLNALTHKSYLAERPNGTTTNERMEFLGDAVLGVVVTSEIYNKFPDHSEGDLAKLRANIVNSETLASIAKEMGIGEDVIMGRGTEQSGGRETVSILENTLEAIIGAIYIDGGMEKAEEFILKNFEASIKEKSRLKDYTDPKTALQEKSIEIKGERPIYRIIEEKGPFHDRIFIAQVSIMGDIYGVGEGKSKKKAEQKAAFIALNKLTKDK